MQFIWGLVLMCLVNGVVGWGSVGHQAIAQCAQGFLSTSAAAAVATLLQPGQTFANISTYADTYRYMAGGAWSAPMHYTNVALGTTKYRYPLDCPGLCVVSGIFNYTDRLINKVNGQPPEPTNLEWIVHLIADVHQPLHVGYAADSGGNGVTVYWYGTKTNLHSVWDTSILVTHLGSTTWQQYAEELQMTLQNSTLFNEFAKSADPIEWANESLQVVITNVYDFTGDQLGDAYLDHNWPAVNLRALKACARLATAFNIIFK
eukprot:Phypoly_transcript_14449.p1 GENE.Phypoly_transcript_14449~~Phypoly_transcript_14449.p1  ORF type:complete len:261 (+),score=25.36 Phypoly_transcript_14449:95-877(+)